MVRRSDRPLPPAPPGSVGAGPGPPRRSRRRRAPGSALDPLGTRAVPRPLRQRIYLWTPYPLRWLLASHLSGSGKALCLAQREHFSERRARNAGSCSAPQSARRHSPCRCQGQRRHAASFSLRPGQATRRARPTPSRSLTLPILTPSQSLRVPRPAPSFSLRLRSLPHPTPTARPPAIPQGGCAPGPLSACLQASRR